MPSTYNSMTEKKTTKETRALLIVAALLIALDQATKIAVKGFSLFGIEHQGMYYAESISVIGDLLQITFIENPGMALGITFGSGKIFLSLFSIFAGIGLGYYLIKLEGFSRWVRIGIMLIFAGAMGNLIDRVFYGVFYGESALFYGKVVDFVQVDIPDIDFLGLSYTHWPVFNVADSCVSCGVVLLLLLHNKIPTFKQVFGNKPAQSSNNTDNGIENSKENSIDKASNKSDISDNQANEPEARI